jgi:3-dehydroquinate dehydratase-2
MAAALYLPLSSPYKGGHPTNRAASNGRQVVVMTATVFVLNGPNLNLLGTREPAVYGTDTLADVEQRLAARAGAAGFAIEMRQTNHEGTLVDWVQEAGRTACGIILNPGAYGHSSIALHDALKAISVPAIEVHLSNIHAREPFRRHSAISPAVRGLVVGFGALGYELALDGLLHLVGPAQA